MNNPRSTYQSWQHGSKGSEQQRLETNGTTFQSEHIYGLKGVNPQMTRSSNTHTRQVENQSPAYQEIKPLHRDHPGTGSSQIGTEYRQHQQSLTSGTEGLSAGGQYNMVLYNDPNAMKHGTTFQSYGNVEEKRKSNNALMNTVSQMQYLPMNATNTGGVEKRFFTDEDRYELRTATVMRNMPQEMSTQEATLHSQRIANFNAQSMTTSYLSQGAMKTEDLSPQEAFKLMKTRHQLGFTDM